MISANGVDYEEILRLYRIADNKGEQILILAELTASDEETIIEVLKDHGAFKPEDVADSLRTCEGCGRKYISTTKRGRAVCPQCAALRKKRRENEKKRQKRNQEKREETRWKKWKREKREDSQI